MADRGERPPRSDLVYGLQPVREALRGRRRVREIVCTSEAAASMPWIQDSGVRMSIAVAERVTALAERPDHQGVAVVCDPYPYADAAALLARPDALVVALDGVTDPRNLGAIMRSAETAGATGIVLPRHRSVRITPVVAKTAAGAIEYLPVALVGGIPAAIERAARAGCWAVGLDERGDRSLFELDLADQPIVVVVGSEGRGLARLTRERCDVLVRIPTRGHLASLNVSAAATLACHEVARRRHR
jgi:23S rRNA (guanosine2251-2'-O)-methyltransferase